MDGNLVKLLVGIVTVLMFLAVGIVCTFYPVAVQDVLTGRRPHPLSFLAPRSGLTRAYIESRWYIVHLIFCGVIALLGAVSGLFGLALSVWG